MASKSFHDFVLTYRGADWSDPKARFAEAAYEDSAFPKRSENFDELSYYVEMQADEYMTTAAFDELWTLYTEKYSLGNDDLW